MLLNQLLKSKKILYENLQKYKLKLNKKNVIQSIIQT